MRCAKSLGRPRGFLLAPTGVRRRVALGCLDYVLEEGARWDWFWDDTIRTCAWIAGLAGIGFIIRCLTFGCPIVDLRALASRNFALGCWFSFVTGVGHSA